MVAPDPRHPRRSQKKFHLSTFPNLASHVWQTKRFHTASDWAEDPPAVLRALSPRVSIGSSVCAEKSIPEEVDDREIAVAVQVMNQMKLPLASEPGEAREYRVLRVVCLVKVDVPVK
jgi:hypothetical protein